MLNDSSIKRFNTRVEVDPTQLGKLKLEIGCGEKKVWNKKCNIRMDVVDFGQEIVWDVEKGIPLPDNSCEYIYSNQVFEHLHDLLGVMNECHRVLHEEGKMRVIVPEQGTEKALLPNHTRQFSKYTFDFFQYEAYSSIYQSSLWRMVRFYGKEGNLYALMQPIKNEKKKN